MATKLREIVNMDDLRQGIDDGFITIRKSSEQSPHDQFMILNYSKTAQITKGAWDNPAVRICRGLIIDSGSYSEPQGWMEVVARPWAKFFNYGQSEAGDFDMDAPVEVTDKKDGSLGIIHFDSGGYPRVATRGSFDSEMANWATRWIYSTPGVASRLKDAYEYLLDYTILVEIVYPENRIVLDYGDYEGLILLGAVKINSGEYIGPNDVPSDVWGGDRTEVFLYSTLAEALSAPPRKNAEGLCVRFLEQNKIVKVKQEDYLRLHKLIFGLNERSVWEYMLEHGIEYSAMEKFCEDIPDEFHGWVRRVWSEARLYVNYSLFWVDTAYALIVEDLPLDFTQKDFAMAVIGRHSAKIEQSALFLKNTGQLDYKVLMKNFIKNKKNPKRMVPERLDDEE